MSKDTQTADAEIVSHPSPRFDLRDAKPPTYNESVEAIMSKLGIERWQAEGVLGDLVMRKATKETQTKIAARWAIPFGDVTRCYNMGKVTIEDARQMMGTKSLVIANAALDGLMDDLNDPMKAAKMDPKTKLAIAKGMTDNALNLDNKSVAGGTTNHVDVGTVQILIQNRADREKEGGSNVAQRLLAKGLNPELIAKALDSHSNENK